MTPLLIATKNAHKTAEFQALLAGRFQVVDLCSAPQPAPEESGTTIVENAAIKALAASQHFEGWVLADDSGLCVDALGGAPGVLSARYAGPDASDADNRRRLLLELAAVTEVHQRRARFECVLVLACAGMVHGIFSGTVEGRILEREQGEGGFGYDALFVPEGHAESFGVLPVAVKNSISHRARALAAFCRWLEFNECK